MLAEVASEGYYIIMWTVWDLFVWDQEMELVQYIDRLSLKEEEQTSSHFSSMMQAININQQYNSNKLYCCLSNRNIQRNSTKILSRCGGTLKNREEFLVWLDCQFY